MLFFYSLFVSRDRLIHATVHTKRKRKWPQGYRDELLTVRLPGETLGRKEKLVWGRETTTEVPYSQALNPHKLWRGHSVDKTVVDLGNFQV